jgi:hypothetical protein
MDISDNALDSEYECISSSESLVDTDFSEHSEDENESTDYNHSYAASLSRQSSSSHLSSRDSDATGPWIDPHPTDDDEPLDHPFVLPSDSGNDLAQEVAPAEEDNLEDQKVKEALDQSMVSTLSTSRSGSFGRSSMTSPRPRKDIRLSFPDPIASTTDDIRRSYEELDAIRHPSLPFSAQLPRRSGGCGGCSRVRIDHRFGRVLHAGALPTRFNPVRDRKCGRLIHRPLRILHQRQVEPRRQIIAKSFNRFWT